MPRRLYISRYASASIGGTNPNENFRDISELGIRWAVPGGIHRIEFTIPAFSGYDPYRRYDLHLGHTIAVYDGYLDKYISGQVYEIVPDGRHVTYVCAGPWKRAYDDLYDNTDFPGSGNTNAIIKDILTDSVSIESTNQSNIAGSLIPVGGWAPDDLGSYAGDAIRELAVIGHSDNSPMDFYFADAQFQGLQMQAPLPFFKKRSTTASPDWVFSTKDLAPNGLTLARHIWDLKTHVWIGFGRLGGIADAGSGASLIDSGSTFITDGVRPGDRAINVTDNAVFEVDTVDSETQLSFTDTTASNWALSDVFSIRLRDPKWTSGQTPPSTDYWNVRYREKRMEMDETQANKYRDQIATLFSDAQQQQAFVISAPYIHDGFGTRWSLWRVFMNDSYYFRADDLFPEAAIFSSSDDRKATFMAVAMDYKYSNNRLRVVPSTGDSRLDSILGQAGLIQGQLISTETAWRNRKREEERVH
jgi:hypothetical protein